MFDIFLGAQERRVIHHDHSADRPYSHRSKLFWRRAYLEEHLLKKGACIIKIDQFSYSSIGNVRHDCARYVLNHRRRNVKIVDFYRYGYCMIVAYIMVWKYPSMAYLVVLVGLLWTVSIIRILILVAKPKNYKASILSNEFTIYY